MQAVAGARKKIFCTTKEVLEEIFNHSGSDIDLSDLDNDEISSDEPDEEYLLQEAAEHSHNDAENSRDDIENARFKKKETRKSKHQEANSQYSTPEIIKLSCR